MLEVVRGRIAWQKVEKAEVRLHSACVRFGPVGDVPRKQSGMATHQQQSIVERLLHYLGRFSLRGYAAP